MTQSLAGSGQHHFMLTTVLVLDHTSCWADPSRAVQLQWTRFYRQVLLHRDVDMGGQASGLQVLSWTPRPSERYMTLIPPPLLRSSLVPLSLPLQ